MPYITVRNNCDLSWKRSNVALLASVINCLPSFPVCCAMTFSAWRWQEIRFWPPMQYVYDWPAWVSGRWGCASAIPMWQPLPCRAYRWPFTNANTSSKTNAGTALHWRTTARCHTTAPSSTGVSVALRRACHLPEQKCVRKQIFFHENPGIVFPAELALLR